MSERNLVLCIDGTDDFAAKNPTHVFQLFRTLERSDRQRIYYDGGVGTLNEEKLLTRPLITFYRLIDLASGFSVRSNFIRAYEFLIDNYQENDQIFILGFSRGAYASRAIAAAINYYGIPEKEQKNLVPYIWQQFSRSKGESRFEDMSRLKGSLTEEGSFRRKARVHFVGLWDTVSSFGLINLRTLPGTSVLKGVDTVRHAVSIDEKRNMFPENLCSPGHPDLKEVWFAGVHRDVGGGGKKGRLGLSMCAFDWMVGELVSAGLKVDPKKKNHYKVEASDPTGPMNDNYLMLFIYALIGLIPMKMWSNHPFTIVDVFQRLFRIEDKAREERGAFVVKWLNLWHRRRVPSDGLVHESVVRRMEELGYKVRGVKPIDLTTDRIIRTKTSDSKASHPTKAVAKTDPLKKRVP